MRQKQSAAAVGCGVLCNGGSCDGQVTADGKDATTVVAGVGDSLIAGNCDLVQRYGRIIGIQTAAARSRLLNACRCVAADFTANYGNSAVVRCIDAAAVSVCGGVADYLAAIDSDIAALSIYAAATLGGVAGDGYTLAQFDGADVVDAAALFGTDALLVHRAGAVVGDGGRTDGQVTDLLCCIDAGTGVVLDGNVSALFNGTLEFAVALEEDAGVLGVTGGFLAVALNIQRACSIGNYCLRRP